MSIDRSLKQHGGMAGTRSVLTRAERIAKLTDEGRFEPDKTNPFGLPKVKVVRSRVGSKAKKEEAAAEGEAPAAGAAAAAPAAAAKGAAPAAKGAAKAEAKPAAKGADKKK